MLFVDMAPPRLCVTEEIYVRKFFEDFVKSLKAAVVTSLLNMEQNRHSIIAGNFSDRFDLLRIAVDPEFLLADPNRSEFEIFLDLLPGIRKIRNLICEKIEFARMFPDNFKRGFIPTDTGREPIRISAMRRPTIDNRTGRKQNRRRHPDPSLMSNHLRAGPPAIR